MKSAYSRWRGRKSSRRVADCGGRVARATRMQGVFRLLVRNGMMAVVETGEASLERELRE
jgi:hypothetical protein